MADRFLEGRTALVTGGASGMGRAMARAFARAGARVAVGSLLEGAARADGELSHLPDAAALEAVREEIEACGVRCLAAPLDVTSDASVDAFVEETRRALGEVDVLANAAGITAEQPICGHPDALWHKVVEVNLHGVFRTTKRCLPGMIERDWGRIVNVASTAASVGAPTSGAYCASKAAVVGLSRCVALEGAAHGVTCNTISPSWVQTDFGRSWMTSIAELQEQRSGEAYIADAAAANPQRRLIHPDEVGALALFLCREEARGLTMQDFTVSGGSLW